MTKNNRQIKMCNLGNCNNSVGLKPIAVRLRQPRMNTRSHALRGGTYMGCSASPMLVSRSSNTEDAERPRCIPTQRVVTLFLQLPRSYIFIWRFFLSYPAKAFLNPKTYDRLLKIHYPGSCKFGSCRNDYSFTPSREVLKKSNHLPLKKRPSQFDELLTLAEAEKQFILKTYEYTSGNKSQTAKILDVAIITVRKKLASYGVK